MITSIIEKSNRDGINRKARDENRSSRWNGDKIDEEVNEYTWQRKLVYWVFIVIMITKWLYYMR